MMTAEQQLVLLRCKRMIKRAFPSMNGKFIFVLDGSKYGGGIDKGIDVHMFIPSLRLESANCEAEIETVNAAG
jgi:hypothetical protein